MKNEESSRPECLAEEKRRLLDIILLIDEVEELYAQQSQNFRVDLGLDRVEQRLQCLLFVLREKSDQIILKKSNRNGTDEPFICLNFLKEFGRRGLISELRLRRAKDQE